MLELSNSGFETVWNDGEFLLSRSANRGASSPVLVLTPAVDQATPTSIARLKNAYELRNDLDPDWAARPLEFIHQQGKPVLLIEDHGGEVLAHLLGKPWELNLFLHVAIGITEALGRLHQRGFVHKDIKPGNVFVNISTGGAWLSGFGIASRLPRERQKPEPPEFIAGTLPYMAPEQTGRMNRSIDSRSDLYALGVTLYEMLTGSLPFSVSDPIELVHCHIARKPLSPGERLKSIPGAVSAIVMKLLAKTAEQRYQTAAGAASDLRRCLDELETRGCIDEFLLGEHDAPDRLLIPEKLYGRETEIETLLASFDRVVAGTKPELVLVSGYSGIGKSSIVNELHKPLVPPRGLFASGKFDQYKRDVPYATLAQAFLALLRPLLAKSEAELSKWRGAFLEALAPNACLMTDLVPELKLIIGDQPPVADLEPQQAQNRFQLVFRRFIGVFARPEHPLALFLDDLQWLDAATLNLLEDLLTQSDLRHLILIGAYRDNEVDAAHPLTRKLDAIRRAGVQVQEIRLSPLGRDDLGHLIADALCCEASDLAPLAQLVHEKTAGNPFFVIQFLYTLAEEGLLRFDHDTARWSWDLDRIHAKGYTDNVVDLMAGKLTRLPIETQRALQQFACLGNVAEIAMLSIVLQISEEQVHAALWPAVRQELVERLEGSYRFIHDRVQEAAYSLIPEAFRAEVHLRIGRLLLTQTPTEKRDEAIFDILNQLNRGAALITQREERYHLAELNLVAAKRAKGSAAYASALTYLITGGELLNDDCWERRHELIFALELNRAECEFLTGQSSVADERLAALSKRAKTTVEQATLARLHMDVCITFDQSDRAVAVGLDYLRHVGIEWSPHPNEQEVRLEYERIWSLLGSRRTEDLLNLPLLKDPASLATLDVLSRLWSPALFTDANLAPLTVCKSVSLSLELGNCDASCFAYVMLGRIAGPSFGDYKVGFRFGQLGYELVERRGLKLFEASTYLCFATFVVPWMKHVRACCDLQRRAFETANRIGDLLYAAYACNCLNTDLLFAGEPLQQLQVEAERGLAFAEKARFSLVSDWITTQLALIRMLRGLTVKFGCFDDGQFNEVQMENHLSSNPVLAIAACWHWIRKLQARYIAGDYATAMDAASKAKPLLWTTTALFEEAEYHFYGALTRAACYRDSSTADEREQHLDALVSHHKQLQVWAENCPENFENRAALIGAEIARIEGRELDAEHLYELAIRSARDNGFVHNEAIAYERASGFCRERGFDQFADLYLRNARYCYQRWGADGKVHQLDQLYPNLHDEQLMPGATSTIGTPVEYLDLATVIRVSQAVSGEIVFKKLIDTLMVTALQHAGAERGLLILSRGDRMQIEAEAATDRDKIDVRLLSNAPTSSELPDSVFQYVLRTKEEVIIDDALADGQFSADPYFARSPARSILCLPLVKQARITGVLYFENSLAAHAFTSARIAVLKLLASQAAISLENAYLYTDLRQTQTYLSEAQRLSQTGSFSWVPSSGELIWSSETYRIFDTDPSIKPTLEMVLQRVHPEDRPVAQQFIDRPSRAGDDWNLDQRLLMPDGSLKHLHVVAHGVKNDSSGEVSFVGAVMDVTAAKQSQQALEQAFREIKTLKDQLQSENIALREEIDKASMFEQIVGTSPPLRKVLSRISKVAPTDSSVLITGETGTGKELVARAIHKRSRQSSRPFVTVNCAATPRELIASELFGHEKGAFTGATQRRLGRFELAEGGTIFLDEIGELPAETQIALLRVLQEHEFKRVGGTASIQTNVRVIAATNRDLEAAIASGLFRSDLFYRLNVFPIEIPPLRERREDIPLLVGYFIDRYARKSGKSFQALNKKSLDVLQSYPWPGNIRELQNVIERSVIVCETENFSVDESWLSRRPLATEPNRKPTLSRRLPSEEKAVIEAALRESGGRVYGLSGAAAKLGIPRSTLESKIRSLKINKNPLKPVDPSKDA